MIPLAWSSGGKTGVKSTEVEGYLQTKVRAFHLVSLFFLSGS